MNFKGLPLEQKIGQMFMFGFEGKKPSAEFLEFAKENNIGFFIVFHKNFSSVRQLILLTNTLHSIGKIQPMIFTDQEGGTVCQFGEALSTFVSPMGLAATENPDYAFEAGRGIGEDLKKAGIDGNLAPVVDVNFIHDNPIIGIRAFSDNPETVVNFAEKFIDGLHFAGIPSVLKHYPGHGRASEDSHLSLPEVDVDLDTLRNTDLIPYFKLANKGDIIMSSHINFPNIEKKKLPSTFSEKFNRILREEVGFKGIYMTDCLEMKAVEENFTVEEIVLFSIKGGADILVSSGYRRGFEFQKELFHTFVNLVKTGKIKMERVENSFEKIISLKEKYGLLSGRRIIRKVPLFRENYFAEKVIALSSVKIVRDNFNKIPVHETNSVGIIEWEKVPSTIPISKASKKFYLRESARKIFPNTGFKLLPLRETLSSEIPDFLNKYDEIIVAPFSRNRETERIQGKMINEMLKFRKNIIIVSIGNPYDLRNFPQADEYFCTYGFREVQIEAFFDILTGKYVKK